MKLSLFSLLPSHHQTEGRDLFDIALDRAVMADELGYHGFWVAEHHGRSVCTMPNPAVFLAAAAQRTRRVRLGVAVSVLPMRDPLLTAEDYALVDRLSGGRLDFGVGSGISPVEYAALGIPMEDKREKFEESLAMIRHAWSGEGGEVEGRFRCYGDLHCPVSTAQKPGPPVWRAVGNPEAARAAGESGDYALVLAAPDMGNHDPMSAMAAAYREGVGADVGSRSGAVGTALSEIGAAGDTHAKGRIGAAVFVMPGDTDSEAQQEAAKALDRLAAAQSSDPTGRETVARAIEGGRSFFGSRETIARSLSQLEKAGFDEVLFWFDYGGGPESQIAESMRILSPGNSSY